MKRTYKYLAISAAFALGLAGCQDEVLVETKDNTKVDELLAAIDAADDTYVNLDLATSSLTIENNQLENLIDSLNELSNDLQYASSQPTEIHYTVNVLSAGNAEIAKYSGGSRTEGVVGATVVVEQNGAVLTPSSEGAGLYLFKGLRTGYVYVKVSAPDHADMEYRAYLWKNNGQDVVDAEAFNASSQIVMYPIAGSLAGKISGKAFANTSTLNDTLARRYGSGSTYADAIKSTYISSPGSWSYYGNYTQNDANVYVPYTVYGYPDGEEVQFENALAGHVIYATPYLNTTNPIPTSESGYIYSVTYKNIVTSTTIGADGSYELPVIASSEFNGDLIDGITLYTENYVAGHERYTQSDGLYYGELDEAGSTTFTTKYFNNTDGDAFVYDGVDNTGTKTVAAGHSLTVTRRKVSKDFVYIPYFISQDEHYHTESNGHFYLEPGQAITRNVYFFPDYEKQ